MSRLGAITLLDIALDALLLIAAVATVVIVARLRCLWRAAMARSDPIGHRLDAIDRRIEVLGTALGTLGTTASRIEAQN